MASRNSLVSDKIKVLRAEGKNQAAAVGMAEGMADSHRLRPGGVYVRANKRKSGRKSSR